jgi:hypothetical protein
MNHQRIIHKYDFSQDIMHFLKTLSDYGMLGYVIEEVRVSSEIFQHWVASNDPMFTGMFDPCAVVADMEAGFLGTLCGFDITSTLYVPILHRQHLLPMPKDEYEVYFNSPITGSIQVGNSAPVTVQDLLDLAHQVSSP